VLVQQLVPSDVSAVIFSVNPVTGSCDEVMINASQGLGESIVGGRVTPHVFIVRKSDFAVKDRVDAGKQRMSVPAPGGTQEVDVLRFLRRQASLSGEQNVEMA
jgi:phosphoenolpyruvate synthase/pyruvate phosphate dikinase